MEKERKGQRQSALLSNSSWARAEGWAEVRARHESVEEWLEKHRPLLEAAVCRYGSDIQMEKADVLQEVCLSIWSAWDKYDVNRADVKRSTYLWQVARNTILIIRREENALKRKGNHRQSQTPGEGWDEVLQLLKEKPAPEEALESFVEATLFREALLEGINGLPEQQKEALYLVGLEGLSQMEAAREIGVSQSLVSARLKSARKALLPIVEQWRQESIPNQKKEKKEKKKRSVSILLDPDVEGPIEVEIDFLSKAN